MKQNAITQANKAFTNEHHDGSVCVFAGGTNGIGANTLEKLVQMLRSATFYVIGGSTARFADQRATLERLNPNAKIVFFEGDVTLLSDVDTFAKTVLDAETKVDYLFMSPGRLPLAGAEYTTEGLEVSFTLSYYARMRLTANLLPRLLAAPRARVLSVLNGGKEGVFREDDLGLVDNWSSLAVMAQYTTVTTLAFDHLAAQNKTFTFLQAYPGLVRTGISNLVAPSGSGIGRRAYVAVVGRFVGMLALLFGMTPVASGERHAYHLTSSAFGPGMWRVDDQSEVAKGTEVLKYRAAGWPKRIWEFTVSVFDKI
ncbi:hypothetical protein C8A00DRAFT_43645 [Chaetomidium leptoderma]|uniref:NAD(P)-binding protein n=1 Tax=Chaetomidium leptoderma TaxID=669021 RepID=A0AAN6VNB7_9PEZI|nr:hypothetical protein C8A00DRAFT_43645 [Chaetomidium leptoderma]